MNKYKKIAMAVVATVMAGAMIVPLAACGGNKKSKRPNSNLNASGSDQTQLTPKTDKNGNLTWAEGTTLNLAIGYNSAATGAEYSTDNISTLNKYLGGTSEAVLYGNTYLAGNDTNNFKPAWRALATQLKLNFKNFYTDQKSENQWNYLTTGGKNLSEVDVFTASASDVNKGATGDKDLVLDITKYLKYMPNYTTFLNENPNTRLSLTAGENGAMYLLPYFDGNDDIEKYVLLRKDIVEGLLNATGAPTGTVSFKTQAAAKATDANATVSTSASVLSFMGKTGNWSIAVTDPAALDATADAANDWGSDAYKTKSGQSDKTINITVNYDLALANAKSTAAGDMGKILSDAGVSSTAIDGQTSGNIVDIMNVAINQTNGDVTGATLIQLLRKYIEVAYRSGSDSFYTTGGRKVADVFNSAYAAWDVDLYVALGRCFVTSGTMLGGKVKETKDLYLITGRTTDMSRYNDIVALAGELYGVRGLYGLYQYTYLDKDGNMKDSRTNAKSFEALDNMNKLAKEGLLLSKPAAVKTGLKDGEASHSGTQNTNVQTLSLRDYVQSQTKAAGFRAENGDKDTDADYNFAPVYTPVSKWDDGSGEKMMRFTESWRTVKTTGFGISFGGVKDSPDKLSAALALVDFMFSKDGQILMTYGPQATNGDDDGSVEAAKKAGNGFWYGNEVTNVKLSDTNTFNKIADAYGPGNCIPAQYESLNSDYFVYNGKVYTGTFYNGRQIPTMTKSNLAMFHSDKLAKDNFTNYARYFIGATLPIGNKDQGFEYQCTAKCGLRGADIVNIGLNNGTIEHVVQQIPGENKLSLWYSVVPTVLFYRSDIQKNLTEGTSQYKFQYLTGFNSSYANYLFTKTSSDCDFHNDIMAYGLGSAHAISKLNTENLPDSAQACVEWLRTYGMDRFQTYMDQAWKNLLGAYDIKLGETAE